MMSGEYITNDDSISNKDNNLSQTMGSFKLGSTQLTIKPNNGKIDLKIFVGQIPKFWNEEDVTSFFSKFGEIIESQIIKDPKTNAHKGCAFVKFASMTKADEAIKKLGNVTIPGANAGIQLRWADGELERLGLAGIDDKQQTKLFIGSIPKSAKEDNLQDIFRQYGKIEELHLMKETDGSSKGCAFIKYELKESALLAIRALNAQAYIQDSEKPIEVRFADKKKISSQVQQAASGEVNRTQKDAKQNKIQEIQMSQMMQLQGGIKGQFPNNMMDYNNWMYYQNGGQYPPFYNPMMQQYQSFDNLYMQKALGQGQQQICINDLSGGQQNPKQQGPAGANLFIFHLPNDWKESDLYTQFKDFGTIISARIMTDKNTGRSKGYGFISYDDPQSAQEAIIKMNGFHAGNKRLKVQIKKGTDDNALAQGMIPTLQNTEYKPY